MNDGLAEIEQRRGIDINRDTGTGATSVDVQWLIDEVKRLREIRDIAFAAAEIYEDMLVESNADDAPLFEHEMMRLADKRAEAAHTV
jgi:hypothetical protein